MRYFFISSLLLLFIACSEKTNEEQKVKKEALNNLNLEIPELETIFEKYGYEGSFVLFDLNNNEKKYFNKDQCSVRFSPASTFKIPNSLIALETGVATGKDFIIKWDSKQRYYPQWNKDHDLRSAIKHSVVWYYKEIARRIGREQMKEFIEKLNYGNKNINGEIDEFWLNDSLKISQEEQIDFLIKLYKNELPFSKRTMQIVKEIMVVEETPEYILRAKTGTSSTGWYVGWVEKDSNVYFFAVNIKFKKPFEKFKKDRMLISRDLLKHYGVL